MDLIRELAAHGVRVEVHGERIRIVGGESLPDSLKAELQTHKSEIIAYLTAPKPTVAYYKGHRSIYDQVAYDDYFRRNLISQEE